MNSGTRDVAVVVVGAATIALIVSAWFEWGVVPVLLLNLGLIAVVALG